VCTRATQGDERQGVDQTTKPAMMHLEELKRKRRKQLWVLVAVTRSTGTERRME
jgi:hypothetical protein